MKKNKLTIVIVVGIIGLVSLISFMYFSFKTEETKKEDVEIKFEIPENSNKVNKTSKIEYYKHQVNPDKISKGTLLKKNKPNEEEYIFKDSDHILDEYYFNDLKEQKAEVDENVSNVEELEANNKSDYLDDSYKEPPKDENSLDRLLNIMESNSEQINNIGSPKDVTDNLNNLINLDKIASIVRSTETGQEKKKKDENIYRNKLIEEKSPKDVFFGATKNKKAFTGSVSDIKIYEKKLFKAEFYTTQVVENGGLITIHLLEDIIFEDGYLIPKSTILYGIAKFSPTRLFLKISPNILKNRKRLPSQIIVLDFDGIEGIFMKQNLLSSIPVETAEELTELVKENYKSSNSIVSNSGSIPLKESAIILGSEKILKYLNRSSLKVYGGYKIWLSLK